MGAPRRSVLATAVLAAGILAFLGVGCGGDEADTHTTTAEGKEVQLLFVIEATSGTLVPAGGDEYTLSLEGLFNHVVAFSDRPERLTFNLSAKTFFARWDRAFGDDPPNAALDLIGGGREADAIILELDKPRYQRDSVTFQARRLKRASRGLAHYRDRLVNDPPRRLRDLSLFIDSAGSTYVPLEFWFTLHTGTSSSLHPEEPQPSGSANPSDP